MKQLVLVIALFFSVFLFGASCSQSSQKETPLVTNNNTQSQTVQPELQGAAVPDYQWVQLGEGGAVIARAIFKQSATGCPNIETIGKDPNDPNKPASEVIDKFTFSYIDVENDSWKVTVMDQDGEKEKATYTIKR